MTLISMPGTAGAPGGKTHQSCLTDHMLAGFVSRARRYDEQNSFFAEDFQDLRESGYLPELGHCGECGRRRAHPAGGGGY